MAGMCVLFAALGMLLYYPARPLNRLIARSKENPASCKKEDCCP